MGYGGREVWRVLSSWGWRGCEVRLVKRELKGEGGFLRQQQGPQGPGGRCIGLKQECRRL